MLMGRSNNIKSSIRLFFILGIALVICFLLEHLAVPSTVIILILQIVVLTVSFLCGIQYAYIAVFLETVSLIFFFTHPQYSLQVDNSNDILNITLFILVALIVCKLTEHYKKQQISLENIQLRNRILLSVSHDYRTPLSTIIGVLTTLNTYRKKLSETQIRTLLDSAIIESYRLHQYIENLLQATKIQNGTFKINMGELSIVQIIYGVIERLPDSRHRIKFKNNDYIPLIMASHNLIEQAILNIMDNLLRGSKDDSDLNIKINVLNENVVITFYIEGFVFTVEQSDLIFELFYSSRTLSQNDSGIGLGFTVANNIIKAHRGTLEAISDNYGCQFRMSLPLTPKGCFND
ncbi:PAS domain-containing sensor histidine kinase [Shewanella xiamenensis]|uniref:histidine kinase n=2 Tax=Gammaproteobacteria TaxID=1236 RepID=A0AAW6R059_9GAMM|nr:PAS domain-containing sensor histidine kinase [Shewanella xiamenensis]